MYAILLWLLISQAAGLEIAALGTHNALRTRHGAQNLTWSDILQNTSKAWADSCEWKHSETLGVGENLAMGHSTINDAIMDWYFEIDIYNFESPRFSAETGHFTQVVWNSTRRLGCAKGACSGANFWVCQYEPAGNVPGQFQSNVLPIYRSIPAPSPYPPPPSPPPPYPPSADVAKSDAVRNTPILPCLFGMGLALLGLKQQSMYDYGGH